MKRLYRSDKDRILGGICGGIAEFYNLDPALIRIIWIIFTLFGGSGIVAYLIALLIIPANRAPAVENTMDTPAHKSFWSILLIIVCVVLIFQHGDIMSLIWHRFWSSGFNFLFSISLILLGFYFFRRRKIVSASQENRASVLGLHLSHTHKKLAGVCAGMGETLNLDPVILRFIWIFGTIMSAGAAILLYIILALILPVHDKE
ncbi:MAG: PspC domain-containing protein [Candidatus Neomarinimicrobiota bacterium]